MSYINIPFGTRKGGGEELKDVAPFVCFSLASNTPEDQGTDYVMVKTPDMLCEQCVSILRKILYDMKSMHVNPENPTGCRLCALLISRFTELDRNKGHFEVHYRLEPRFGYFFRVHDIAFLRPGSNKLVRLGLQMVKLEGAFFGLLCVTMNL